MKKHGLPCYPTRNLGGLLFVFGVIWYAASSQNSPAIYLLLFALVSVFLVSIPHTLLNLSGLTTTVESIKPGFAGQEITLPVAIVNQSKSARRGVILQIPGAADSAARIDHVAAQTGARVTLRFPASKRGEHRIERICLTSEYPLGFIRAEQNCQTSQHYLVYPKPAGDRNFPITHGRSGQLQQLQSDQSEGHEFAGTRAYIPGESQRHIDWKAVARGQPLMTKQFTAESESSSLCLDYAMAPFSNVEDKLSQLTLWVIEAERNQRPYALRLPRLEIPASFGEQHFHRCLRALALFK